METKNTFLLTSTPWKAILRFSIPIFFGSVLQQTFNIVDAVIAGNMIGKHALAAVSACGAVMFLLSSLFMGIGIGATSIISQYFGAKDEVNLRKSIDTFMICVYVASLVFLIFGYFLSDILLKILNTPDDIFNHAKAYLMVIFFGGIGLFGYTAAASILQGVGDSKTPLKFLILAGILNTFLNIIFVKTTNLQVAGLALATAIAYFLSFIACVIYINKYHSFIALHLRHAHLSFWHLKKIIKIGIPSGVQQMSVSLGYLVIQSLINSFGSTVMAGVGSAEKLEQIVLAPVTSLTAALSVYIGQNIGAGNMNRVNKGLSNTIIMVIILSVVLSFLTISTAPYTLHLFNKDPEVIKEGVHYLNVVGPFYVVLGLSFTLLGVMRGASATFIPMVFGIIAQLVIRAPIAYLLVHIFKSTTGIWLAIPTSWVFSVITLFIYYFTGKWRNHIAIYGDLAKK